MHAKICSITVFVLIAAALIAVRCLRWRKRRDIVESLDQGREKCIGLDRSNAEKLASLEHDLAVLGSKASVGDLAPFRQALELAREECGRASRSLQAVRESIGRMMGKRVPTETLPSFIADYEWVHEDLLLAQRVLGNAETKKNALDELERSARQKLESLAGAIDERAEALREAEGRGFKLDALRAELEDVKRQRAHIRDVLWPGRELASAVRGSETALAVLGKIGTALESLDRTQRELGESLAGLRRRIERVRGSFRKLRPTLWYLESIKSGRLGAARQRFSGAEGSAAKAEKLLIKAGMALADLDLPAAAALMPQAEACAAEAEEGMASVQASDPRNAGTPAQAATPHAAHAALETEYASYTCGY